MVSFLQLPAELRNRIYQYVLHWEPLSKLVEFSSNYRPRMGAILLVNQQIHDEASYILYDVCIIFNINSLKRQVPLYSYDLCDNFGKLDLQQFRKVVIDIRLDENCSRSIWVYSHLDWERVISGLVSVWKEKNSLESLEVMFRDIPRYGPAALGREDGDGEWKLQKEMLGALLQLRGIKSVVIKGDIEKRFARELKSQMEGSNQVLAGPVIPAKEIEDISSGASSETAESNGA